MERPEICENPLKVNQKGIRTTSICYCIMMSWLINGHCVRLISSVKIAVHLLLSEFYFDIIFSNKHFYEQVFLLYFGFERRQHTGFLVTWSSEMKLKKKKKTITSLWSKNNLFESAASIEFKLIIVAVFYFSHYKI